MTAAKLDMDQGAREAAVAVEKIRRVLARRHPAVVGAVLADLLAIWLASHVVPGDEPATEDQRERLLQAHLERVRQLIPINVGWLREQGRMP